MNTRQQVTVTIDWRNVERTALYNEAAALEAGACNGTCLAPWLNDGDVFWFDPTLSPQPGDLVACEILYEKKQRLGMISGGLPPAVRRMTLKQWQIDDDGKVWLCCNEGAVELGSARVLGVVTQLHRQDRSHPIHTMVFAPQTSEGI